MPRSLTLPPSPRNSSLPSTLLHLRSPLCVLVLPFVSVLLCDAFCQLWSGSYPSSSILAPISHNHP
jgi:hypothetical protein